jgi:hypothetical protein
MNPLSGIHRLHAGGEQAPAQIAASLPACNAMHQFIANNNARE